MGCDDYTDFKQCVIDYQLEIKDKVHLPKVNVNALQGDKEYKDTLKGWLNQMQEYANTALLEVNRTQLCELAEDILDYNYVYLFGIGMANIVGEQLRIHLARIGKLAISLTEPQKDVPLTSDKDNTLAVVFSQHGNFFKYEPEILPYLKRNCGKTWLITQCPASKRFDVSETIRIKANENIEAEYHVLLYFEELLSACCHDLKKQNSSKI
jgi:DNA-binding MurR/RpiR family transcriptional regulator